MSSCADNERERVEGCGEVLLKDGGDTRRNTASVTGLSVKGEDVKTTGYMR